MASILDASQKEKRDKLCHTCPDITERGNKTRGVLLANRLGKVGDMVPRSRSSYGSLRFSSGGPCHDGQLVKRDHG